jgi:hypothetical protein
MKGLGDAIYNNKDKNNDTCSSTRLFIEDIEHLRRRNWSGCFRHGGVAGVGSHRSGQHAPATGEAG